MLDFEYLEPTTVEEACTLLQSYGDEAVLMSGGAAVTMWISQRLLAPEAIISLAKIPNFDYVRFSEKDGLTIGAGARHRDIEMSPLVRQHYPLLYETFSKVAQPRIRYMATIGGNLCTGDPATDPGTSLMALDAEVTLTSTEGKRVLSLEEFFVDYYQTALKQGEVLTEVRVPPPAEWAGWSRIKFTPRTEEDFATVGVSVALKVRSGECEDIRLALNSVAPVIVRAHRAEEVLRGKRVTDELVNEAGEVAATEVEPTDDMRGSADYKRHLVKVLVPRAMRQALERIDG
ncbi:MAG: xanthine dehydrogenase family protein subunit M [Chloroflexi bacterium]|nr:xanthine dehydrogenase family protein subunit M [Chloroflexota bacterium]